jgi:integrase
MTALDGTTSGLAGLCGRARPELACLGELAAPLVAMVGVVEQVGAGRGIEALGEPTFALDVLAAAGPGADPAVVGRVLDFLRTRTTQQTGAAPTVGSGATTAGVGRRPVTVADAVERYEATALALLAAATREAYTPWLRRLVDTHGPEDPAMVTAGDLKDIIAACVIGVRERGKPGRVTEEMAVCAYRSFWRYLGDKRWATDNVAARLRKPARLESARRGWRPEEAALARHLARGMKGSDPDLNEVTLGLSERLGLRRDEGRTLRISEIDWDRAEAKVHGKGGKIRVVPIPPVFFGVLRAYVETRRPAHVPLALWLRSDEHLLRYKPTATHPEGRRAGPQRVDRIMGNLRRAAPELFPSDELFFHTHRHALGNWCELTYRRSMARRALGHTSNKDSTDFYLGVTLDELAEALTAYEQYLLAADPRHKPDPAACEAQEVAA